MNRFYFHIKQGEQIVHDDEGLELPNIDAAKNEAIRGARDILSDAIKSGSSKVPEALLVADDSGQTVAFVPLIAVLPEALRR
jgi:hypothetical protein